MAYQLPSFSVTSATGFWHRNFHDLQDDTEQVASAIGIPVYDAARGRHRASIILPKVPACSSKTLRGSSPRSFVSPPPPRDRSNGSPATSTRTCIPRIDTSVLAPQATPILGGTERLSDQLRARGPHPERGLWDMCPGGFRRISRSAAGVRYYRYSLNETVHRVRCCSPPWGSRGTDVPFNAATLDLGQRHCPEFYSDVQHRLGPYGVRESRKGISPRWGQ